MDYKCTYDIISKSSHTSSCRAEEYWLLVSFRFILPKSSDILIIVQNYRGLVVQAVIAKRNLDYIRSQNWWICIFWITFMSVRRIGMEYKIRHSWQNNSQALKSHRLTVMIMKAWTAHFCCKTVSMANIISS